MNTLCSYIFLIGSVFFKMLIKMVTLRLWNQFVFVESCTVDWKMKECTKTENWWLVSHVKNKSVNFWEIEIRNESLLNWIIQVF